MFHSKLFSSLYEKKNRKYIRPKYVVIRKFVKIMETSQNNFFYFLFYCATISISFFISHICYTENSMSHLTCSLTTREKKKKQQQRKEFFFSLPGY